MRRLGTVALVLLAACGDPPLCPSEVFVAIQTAQVVGDADPDLAGVQAEIRVRASGEPGDVVTLEVLGDDGGVMGTATAPLGADQTAVFSGVTVEAPVATLRASVDTECGIGRDELEVPVATGADTIALELFDPPLGCGARLTAESDRDPSTDGLQLRARVVTTGSEPAIELTTSAGTDTLDASADLELTLVPGTSQLVATAVDALGNRIESPSCELVFSDLAINFAEPVASGTLGRRHGEVTAEGLSLPICGSVNRDGAGVTVSIDGAAAIPAIVDGTSWCVNATLSETPPAHLVVATATAGSSFGSAAITLAVDVTSPPAATGLTALAVNRQRIRVDWQAPDDGGQPVAAYRVKLATTTLTEANFDDLGIELVAPSPGGVGANETTDVFPARTGTAYWIGVATLDAAGNRSEASVVGPITPGFQRTGPIVAPDPSLGALQLGYAIAHGKFNDDELEDLAVSAPGQSNGVLANAGAVYVYFGGPSGIAPAPDLVITGLAAQDRFGTGLAAVRWTSATRDDLVIGAPGAGDGELRLFAGGATFVPGARDASTAELAIRTSATAPGSFATSALGSALDAADFDGDGTVDLIAAAPTAAGVGGIVILYGGTVTGDVALSDVDPSGANGAIAELFLDPGPTPGRQLGFYLHAVGPLEGTTDATDDLVVAYADDYTAANDSVFVLRGDGVRPASPGVTPRGFVVGRDVRIDFGGTVRLTELGAQAMSIDDQDGDGARELVLAAQRARSGSGQVYVVPGRIVGTSGVATLTEPGVALSTINGLLNAKLGAFFGSRDGSAADLDGDGREDLVIGGAPSGVGRVFVWFGGEIPLGATTTANAPLVIDLPATMTLRNQSPRGFAGQARWVGDLDGDGLDDLCWSSPFDNSGDGSFEVVSD